MKDFYIYIAGPYTKGDVAKNVRRAVEVAEDLILLSTPYPVNIIPYIPHLSHFWHLLYPKDLQTWYDFDLKWLDKCDAVFRFEGESDGADGEVKYANLMHKIVFTNYNEVEGYLKLHYKN